MATLHLIVGPWAAGKTSLTPVLQRLLPDCVVFDWDVIIPGLSSAADKDVHTDPSTWAGLKQTWFAILNSVLSGGHDAVLCGPVTPAEISADRVRADSVRCAYLDWPDEVLAKRLRARVESEVDIAEELATAASLRASPHDAIPATGRDPHQLARDVAAWVRAGAPRAASRSNRSAS